jgi:hypothetical protein
MEKTDTLMGRQLGRFFILHPSSFILENVCQKAILFPLWPLRLARSRTQDFHSCNTGSNPVGVTRRSGESPPPIAFLDVLSRGGSFIGLVELTAGRPFVAFSTFVHL